MASDMEISRAIKPVAKTARAHNALVNLIRTMQGEGGVRVTVSDGRIIIDGTGVATANITPYVLPDPLTIGQITVTGNLYVSNNAEIGYVFGGEFEFLSGPLSGVVLSSYLQNVDSRLSNIEAILAGFGESNINVCGMGMTTFLTK